MSFSSTNNGVDAAGKGYACGTYDASGVTSGAIATGLRNIEFAALSASSGSPSEAVLDWTTTPGTIAVSGLTTSQTGGWFAIGR